ncbi:hypothetical protein LN650_08285 [Klebsiella pneumoniae subsp. pneumoniae]|nr:hypothetical protein [Klebsiella pneumoniae subsp. pneumoniae]
MHITDEHVLMTPEQLEGGIPAERRAGSAVIAHARQTISDIIAGRDPLRLLVVCGPCSIHDPGSCD